MALLFLTVRGAYVPKVTALGEFFCCGGELYSSTCQNGLKGQEMANFEALTFHEPLYVTSALP